MGASYVYSSGQLGNLRHATVVGDRCHCPENNFFLSCFYSVFVFFCFWFKKENSSSIYWWLPNSQIAVGGTYFWFQTPDGTSRPISGHWPVPGGWPSQDLAWSVQSWISCRDEAGHWFLRIHLAHVRKVGRRPAVNSCYGPMGEASSKSSSFVLMTHERLWDTRKRWPKLLPVMQVHITFGQHWF